MTVNYWIVFAIVLALLALNSWLRVKLAFYRGYFREKQWGLGKDPDETLEGEFGGWWRLWR